MSFHCPQHSVLIWRRGNLTEHKHLRQNVVEPCLLWKAFLQRFPHWNVAGSRILWTTSKCCSLLMVSHISCRKKKNTPNLLMTGLHSFKCHVYQGLHFCHVEHSWLPYSVSWCNFCLFFCIAFLRYYLLVTKGNGRVMKCERIVKICPLVWEKWEFKNNDFPGSLHIHISSVLFHIYFIN
jgi:hypothetical protein